MSADLVQSQEIKKVVNNEIVKEVAAVPNEQADVDK